MLLAIWLGISGAIAIAFRKTGWRVVPRSLTWPTWPLLAARSKYLHARKRRSLP